MMRANNAVRFEITTSDLFISILSRHRNEIDVNQLTTRRDDALLSAVSFQPQDCDPLVYCTEVRVSTQRGHGFQQGEGGFVEN